MDQELADTDAFALGRRFKEIFKGPHQYKLLLVRVSL